MTDLEIKVRSDPTTSSGGPLGVALRVGEVVLTRLIRPHEREADDYLLAPPAQLAFWLVDNWWRIRWECIPPVGMPSEWRLSHELSAIGGGYVWPRLAIWGEGSRIGLLSRSDPSGVVGPVRYLTDALLFIAASQFETATDEFLSNAIDAVAETDTDRGALRAQVRALRSEREDSDVAAWRRMEARLGFDPDEAPEKTIERLAAFATRYGDAGVEEAAMATPGAHAADALAAEIEAAQASRVECGFNEAVRACTGSRFGIIQCAASDLDNSGGVVSLPLGLQGSSVSLWQSSDGGEAPWTLAEYTATSLRLALGLGSGPLRNRALGELLATSVENFRMTSPAAANTLPYGLRLASEDGRRDRVAIRSRWPHDRRFEMVRALGDAIWANEDRLGPLAASKTARQKFQRAFAQSLLCPYEDLISYVGTDQPVEADISAAAQHFHVSERVVRTVLVNKGVLGRHRLERLHRQDFGSEQLEELVDAA
ncbi:MAG TPA: hypothetical protein VND19_24930 [Acetobacteraceae bacterium]|nr:hypothetical protein [Acetobacteraceae bacterium]